MANQNNDKSPSFPVNILQVLENGISSEGYEELSLITENAKIEVRFYAISETKAGVIFVGGVGGGFDSPSHLLYHKLSADLLNNGFSSLRIKYRNSHNFEDSLYDVLVGLSFLRSKNIDSIGLVGHSMGGAVVIRAAAVDTSVASVITLAAQSYGTSPVSELGSGCSLLLIHGSEDNILPPDSSKHIYAHAHEPKKLSIYNAGHKLDEAAPQIYEEVKEWLITWVRGE